ncbi:MAG: gamma carbonic anhydrase family protein [Candidatus Helarchaeota archaeon]
MLYSFNGDSPQLNSPAFIAPTAIIIGDVEIGKNSIILFGTVIRADGGRIVIGENTIIEDNVVIHGENIEIGNYVIIQHNSCIHNCKIEDNVLIGTNCTISDNVQLQEGAMILNNSVILPGKVVKKRKKVWSVNNKFKTKRGAVIKQKLIDQKNKSIEKLIKKMKKYPDSLSKL